ncbi:MAG: hypothetical protein NTX49_03645 [Chlamydiae bacterium]|nr:hypothetical protein [Chlamydiota bacterium]
MTHSTDHFDGKEAAEHLKEARLKGMIASSEVHGMEMPGHIAAFADTVKDTSMALLVIWSASLVLFPTTVCLRRMLVALCLAGEDLRGSTGS